MCSVEKVENGNERKEATQKKKKHIRRKKREREKKKEKLKNDLFLLSPAQSHNDIEIY